MTDWDESLVRREMVDNRVLGSISEAYQQFIGQNCTSTLIHRINSALNELVPISIRHLVRFSVDVLTPCGNMTVDLQTVADGQSVGHLLKVPLWMPVHEDLPEPV